jgi:hypothetical protein
MPTIADLGKVELGRAILVAEAIAASADDVETTERLKDWAGHLRSQFEEITGGPFRAAAITESGIFLYDAGNGRPLMSVPED